MRVNAPCQKQRPEIPVSNDKTVPLDLQLLTTSFVVDRNTLCALATTSKTLRSIAERFLYQSILVSDMEASGLFEPYPTTLILTIPLTST